MIYFLQEKGIRKKRQSWHKPPFSKPQHATTKLGYRLASWYPIFACRCVSLLGIITDCPSNPTKTTRGSTPEVVTGRLRRVRPIRQNNTGFDTRGCQLAAPPHTPYKAAPPHPPYKDNSCPPRFGTLLWGTSLPCGEIDVPLCL